MKHKRISRRLHNYHPDRGTIHLPTRNLRKFALYWRGVRAFRMRLVQMEAACATKH
jgi:hypothetical protein